MNRKKAGMVGIAAAVILAAGGLTFKNSVDPYEKVLTVADGDTFILEANKQAVRLFGLDAPDPTNCFGPESTARLDNLLSKRKVQLKEPVVDVYGRIVALVYVDGKLINEKMIKEGFAVYRSNPSSGQDVMKKAHDLALENKVGIYSPACTDETPPDPKCSIKGNHDTDREENLYFLPDCPYYSLVNIRRFEGDWWFCSEKEAIAAGFKISAACSKSPKTVN